MIRFVLLTFGFIGLAGCAAGPSLQSQMAGYIGDSPQALVQSLGVPDKQITVNGVQYLAYKVRHSEDVEADDFAFSGFYGGPFDGPFYGPVFYDPGFPRHVDEYSCESTFVLKDGKVSSFVLRGNDCG